MAKFNITSFQKHWGWLIFATIIILVLGINLLAAQPLPDDPLEEVIYLHQAQMYSRAERAVKKALEKNPLNIELNYYYIINHFDLKPKDDGKKRDDTTIEAYYMALTNSPETADIGYFGLGLMRVEQKQYQVAIEYFNNVKNQDLKYLNHSAGYAYWWVGDSLQAKIHFHREIALQGNLADTVSLLSRLYFQQNDFEKIQQLLGNEETAVYVPSQVIRDTALKIGNYQTYLSQTFLAPLQRIEFVPWLATLIICGMWFLFFHRIDIFETEPLPLLLFALILGAVFTLTTFLFSDVLQTFQPLSLGQGWLTDLRYTIIYIGAIEELVKLIPLMLILLLFSQQINEPIDIMIYGGLSALGFATLENGLYFTGYGLHVVWGRFLLSTIGHLSFTGLVCYAWASSRYIDIDSHLTVNVAKRAIQIPKRAIWLVPLGFVAAAVAHGLFDFFLMYDRGQWAMLSYFGVLGLSSIYARFLTNCLNFSPYFNQALAKSDRLNNGNLLISTGCILMLLVFLYDHIYYATSIANSHLLKTFSLIHAVIIIFGAFSLFTLEHKQKKPLFEKK